MGLKIAGPIDDTMLMAWLLEPSSRTLGLKALAGQMLVRHMTELTRPDRQRMRSRSP